MDAGQLGLRNCMWLRREQHHWGEVFWDTCPQGQHTETVFQEQPKLYFLLAAKLDSRRVTHVILGLKAWECCREQLRCGTVWQSRRLPRRGYWWKWSPVAVENPNMLEISHHGMNAKGSSRCRMELAWSKEINLCVQNLRAEQNSDPSPLEEPRLLVDPRHCTQVVCLFVFSLSWVWFCFVQMVTMIWFFLEVRKYLTFFFYL